MAKFFKRFTALVLAATITAPSVVWADTTPEPDLSALRVSDAFAEKHPHGMFEVLAPKISTTEGDVFNYYVLRRGGTEGEVSIDIKAVELSAKYGEDFVLQEKDAFGFYHDLKKSEDNPTLFESQIEANKDEVFTTDRIVSGAAAQFYDLEEAGVLSGTAVEVSEEPSDLIGIDEGLKTEEEAPVVDYADGMGGYTSALHKMHDEATGKNTPNFEDKGKHELDLDSFFEPDRETKDAAKAYAEMFEEEEGISYTMNFDDGEAYKTLRVKVLDDDVYETQEMLIFGICPPTGGGELGSRITSNIYINDNFLAE